MQKALLLSLGVGATLILAVFVGAAAATTGAPVFYDARYPAPAPEWTGPGGYDVSEGDTGEPGSSEPLDEAEADGAPPTPPGPTPEPTPPPSVEPTPPATIPPTGAPETPMPMPMPTPTPTPTPTPVPAPDPESTPPSDADGTDYDGIAPDGTDYDGLAPDATGGDQLAPGGPTPGAPAPTAAPSDEDQQTWLAFQQLVRECMADVGHDYLFWKWWNPGPDSSNRFPAMPADLTADEVAAWELALYGDSAGGDAYRWEDAGCWGYAVHVTGGTH